MRMMMRNEDDDRDDPWEPLVIPTIAWMMTIIMIIMIMDMVMKR